MSLLDAAAAAVEERERREQQAAEASELRREEALKRTLSWWRQNFYRKHYIYQRGKHIEDPENPFPRAEQWHVVEGRGEGGEHPSSTWQCEGLIWICDWEYKNTGSDPAFWDDGWWPTFYVVTEKRERLRWLPLVRVTRRREHSVWTLEHLADVLAANAM